MNNLQMSRKKNKISVRQTLISIKVVYVLLINSTSTVIVQPIRPELLSKHSLDWNLKENKTVYIYSCMCIVSSSAASSRKTRLMEQQKEQTLIRRHAFCAASYQSLFFS